MGRKDKKMIWHKWQKWQKSEKFMPLMPFMPVQIFKGTELLLLVGDGIKTGLDPAERKKKETRAWRLAHLTKRYPDNIQNKGQTFWTRIQFLAAKARLFLISLHSNDCFGRNRRRKNLPARWWSRQESDRSSYRVNDRSKGVILPLDLGEYRFCLHGEWRFVRHG